MDFAHLAYSFNIPDEWWIEAGMDRFVPSSSHYPVQSVTSDKRTILLLNVTRLSPIPRALSHGVFNNDADTGRSAKERVLGILAAFAEGTPLPPVEVVQREKDSGSYRLYHGAHRFYLSVAVGFTQIPAIDISDRSENTSGELDMD